MKRALFILLSLISFSLYVTAATPIKTVIIGEMWVDYGIAYLDVKYHCVSDLLLINESPKLKNYPLKDTIDAKSLYAELKNIKQKSCLINTSRDKLDKQLNFDIKRIKKKVPTYGTYIKFVDGRCIYFGPGLSQSDWILYWKGKLYSVKEKFADAFRNKFTAISVEKIHKDIMEFP